MSVDHLGGNLQNEITREEHNGAYNAKRVTIVGTAPTDSSQANPSIVLTYDADNNVETITKTIGSISYLKTLTWAGGVLTDISSWSEI